MWRVSDKTGRAHLTRMRQGFHLLCIVFLLCASSAGHSDEVDKNSAEPLSAVMQRISAEPGYSSYVQNLLGKDSKRREFLTPGLLDQLRKLILGKDWQRVDHFPSFTIMGLNQSVAATIKVVGNQDAQASFMPDVGEFSLSKSARVQLDVPVTHPTYAEDPQTRVTKLPYGLVMGDGPDSALAPYHAESARLAQVLNRLALNSASAGLKNLQPAMRANKFRQRTRC